MNELHEEALQMVAAMTGNTVAYIKMQIGTSGHFVTLETAAVSMAERALKAEAANREQDAELTLLREEAAENARIIGMSGSREAAKKAEIERLKGLVDDLKEQLLLHMKRTVRASVGEKPDDAYKRGQEDMRDAACLKVTAAKE